MCSLSYRNLSSVDHNADQRTASREKILACTLCVTDGRCANSVCRVKGVVCGVKERARKRRGGRFAEAANA